MLLYKPFGQDLPEDVLRRPEHYLTVISFVFDIAIALALFLLGHAVARLQLPAAAAILSQIIALMYAPILAEYLNRVSPEPVICFLALLLGADMVRACADRDDLSAGTRWAYWGCLAGVGVGAKITFLPVMIALAAVAFPGVRKRMHSPSGCLRVFHFDAANRQPVSRVLEVGNRGCNAYGPIRIWAGRVVSSAIVRLGLEIGR